MKSSEWQDTEKAGVKLAKKMLKKLRLKFISKIYNNNNYIFFKSHNHSIS